MMKGITGKMNSKVNISQLPYAYAIIKLLYIPINEKGTRIAQSV
jgi:hypothetical protein